MRHIENKPWLRDDRWDDWHVFTVLTCILGFMVLLITIFISIDVISGNTGLVDFFSMIGIQAFTVFFLWIRGNLKFRITPKGKKELEAPIGSYKAVLERTDEDRYSVMIQECKDRYGDGTAHWSYENSKNGLKTREEAEEWARSELLRLERIREIKSEKWELTV